MKQPKEELLFEADLRELPTFAFESRAWQQKLGKPYALTEIFRQTDKELIKHLNLLRAGEARLETKDFFHALHDRTWDDNVLPTKL